MSNKVVLKTANSLGAFLDSVISETFKSALAQRALQEKEKQAAAAGDSEDTDKSGDEGGEDTDLFGSENSEGGESEESSDAEPSKTMGDETEKLAKGEIEAEDIISKLNAIRSGRSFKDDTVASAMDQYINSLKKPERVALMAFVKGIAQIVTGEVAGEQAVGPKGDPANVEMTRGNEKKTKHIEPNVIKAAAPKKKSEKGAEDSSGPVPITPKKK